MIYILESSWFLINKFNSTNKLYNNLRLNARVVEFHSCRRLKHTYNLHIHNHSIRTLRIRISMSASSSPARSFGSSRLQHLGSISKRRSSPVKKPPEPLRHAVAASLSLSHSSETLRILRVRIHSILVLSFRIACYFVHFSILLSLLWKNYVADQLC